MLSEGLITAFKGTMVACIPRSATYGTDGANYGELALSEDPLWTWAASFALIPRNRRPRKPGKPGQSGLSLVLDVSAVGGSFRGLPIRPNGAAELVEPGQSRLFLTAAEPAGRLICTAPPSGRVVPRWRGENGRGRRSVSFGPISSMTNLR